jgi:hypothetical protein
MKKLIIALILTLSTSAVFADVLAGKVFINLNKTSEKIRVSNGNMLSVTSKDFLEMCGYSSESEGSYLNGTYSLSQQNNKTIITIKITSPCNSSAELGGFVIEDKGLQNIVFANTEGATIFQEKIRK